MGDFLHMIGNFITSLVSLIGNFISGVVQMLVMIPVSLGFLTNALGYIPAVLATVITAIISVNIVYLIIGR